MNGSSPPLFAKPRPAQTVIWGRKDGFGHLGTGFPPRQLLTSPRKGPADPNFTAYVSAEVVSGLAPPLPLKVFPPGPGARYVRVQEPKPQQSPRASAKELYKAPQRDSGLLTHQCVQRAYGSGSSSWASPFGLHVLPIGGALVAA
ncbi:unnamed protein product [Effrenium voratum]|nr:unnamed protein product [Effrenium voratum]